MIKGSKTKDYYKIELDSASSLKDFSIDRRLYYKKHIEKVKVEEEFSKAIIIGNLVDTLLLEPDEFDNRFHLSSLAKLPTGKMLDFSNALVELTMNDKENKTFEEIATEARKIAQFEWKLPAILDKFAGKDPEIYYKEAIEIKSKGLILVDLIDVTNAEKIVNELKNNEFTRDIINLTDSDRYVVFNQLQIEGFEVDDLPMKAMLDKVIVDKTLKIISPFDLKITWSVEGFLDEYLLYRKGYFQYYIYYWALKDWKSKVGFNDYEINYLTFIVGDSINYYNPLLYKVSGLDMGKAYDGFDKNGKYYPGVKDTISYLKWAKENNIWNISKNNYLNEGIVYLNI